MAWSLPSVLGLFLVAQAPSQTGTGGSAQIAGMKKARHDLAGVLLPLAGSARRSGPFGPGSPPPLGDVQVSSRNRSSQYQPVIAVDPTDRRHLVAAATDQRTNPTASAFYASFDEGQTWSETFFDDSGSPSVAFGADGSIYLAAVRNTGTPPDMESTDVFFGRSYDGGLTTGDWREVTSNNGNDIFAFGPAVLSDTTGGRFDGRIYIAYTIGFFDQTEGWFGWTVAAASKDDGQSWSFDVAGDDAYEYASVTAAIDPDGVLCVSYVGFEPGREGIYFDSSSDGGATFGNDILIASTPATSNPGPSLAVDTSGGPFRGALYVTWTQGGADGPDVVFSKSSDHGATWSTPVLASDVSKHSQFAAAIAVDPEGTVDFSFYDARDDAGNLRVHCYVSRSSDGGATILPNVRVSTADFDPTMIPSDLFRGCAIAASDRNVHPIWTDGRHDNADIFTASANLDLFTDVSSISAATGGTATFTLNPGPLFANAEYHLLGSASGTTPGIDFHFENVPVNYDLLMLATIAEANGSTFVGFEGTLDSTGSAIASLVSGPLPPALVGFQMDFAMLVRLGTAVVWASSPTHLEIGN